MKANINELKRLRYEERLTFSEIAKMFEVTRQNIQIRLRNAGRYESFTAECQSIKKAREILLSNPQFSNVKIAEMEGLSTTTIQRRRAEMLIPKPTKYNYFWHWVNIKNIDECWNWQGIKYPVMGYGRVNIGANAFYAHRIAWEKAIGEIPEGMLVCHICDNPPCCNPNHLFFGTQQDNMTDMNEKGRHQAPLRDDNYAKDALEKYRAGIPINEIAKYHGVTAQSIYRIVLGISYAELY